MDAKLWNSTGKYYNAYSATAEQFKEELFFEKLGLNLCGYPKYHKEEWGECYEGNPTTPGAVMADTFYAQVIFDKVIFIGLANPIHTESEIKLNCQIKCTENKDQLKLK